MKQDLQKNTGEKLKEARLNAGMTMQGVADELGVSRRIVTEWESGNVNLTLSTIEKYCKVLGVKPELVIHSKKGK